MQAKHAKKVSRNSDRNHKTVTRKAVISDKRRLTPSESRIVRQSEKDIAEEKYRKYSSVQELLEAIKNDTL